MNAVEKGFGNASSLDVFLISSFRCVLYVVCFLLDNYPKESIQQQFRCTLPSSAGHTKGFPYSKTDHEFLSFFFRVCGVSA